MQQLLDCHMQYGCLTCITGNTKLCIQLWLPYRLEVVQFLCCIIQLWIHCCKLQCISDSSVQLSLLNSLVKCSYVGKSYLQIMLSFVKKYWRQFIPKNDIAASFLLVVSTYTTLLAIVDQASTKEALKDGTIKRNSTLARIQ